LAKQSRYCGGSRTRPVNESREALSSAALFNSGFKATLAEARLIFATRMFAKGGPRFDLPCPIARGIVLRDGADECDRSCSLYARRRNWAAQGAVRQVEGRSWQYSMQERAAAGGPLMGPGGECARRLPPVVTACPRLSDPQHLRRPVSFLKAPIDEPTRAIYDAMSCKTSDEIRFRRCEVGIGDRRALARSRRPAADKTSF